MRVISGTSGGRKLREAPGLEIRPTSGMVKESIFNIVQFCIEGRRVLDLYAGTGQLGIEALSRGAKSAVFVDTSSAAAKLIAENVKLCGFEAVSTISRRDAMRYLEGCEAFDLIFADPPYSTDLAVRTPEKIIAFDKLSTNGIIICEMRADCAATAVLPPDYKVKEYVYGSVKVVKYEHSRLPREL